MRAFLLFFLGFLIAPSISVFASFESNQEATQASELRIHQLRDNRNSSGYSPQDFYNRIVTPVNQGLPLDREFLELWDKMNSEFHHQRYQVIAHKQHVFIEEVHKRMMLLVSALIAPESDLPQQEKSRIINQFEVLNDNYRKWMEVSDTFIEGNHPKNQRQRMHSYYYYFEGARELLRTYHLAPKIKSYHNQKRGDRAAAITKEVASGAFMVSQILVRDTAHFLNYLNPYHYLPKELRQEVAKHTFNNFTPLTMKGSIPTFFRAYAQAKGYQVSVTGAENIQDLCLKASPHKKNVNLFLPSHRSGIVDSVLFSHWTLAANIKHFQIFANPEAFVGNPFASQLLASIPEIVAVGKWRGYPALTPADKLMDNLGARISPNVINYPQGFVANAGEILPINAKFVETLIKTLVDQDYDVTVIPISYEVDSEFLSASRNADDRIVSAHIHPPLSPNVVRTLVEYQTERTQNSSTASQGRFLDHFLLSLWDQSITRHSELTLEQMIERAERNLGLNMKPVVQPLEILEAS